MGSGTPDIEGTLLVKKDAFTFLGIILRIIDDLKVLFDKSSHKELLSIDKNLEEFIAYKKSTNEFSVKYSTDQSLIYSAAFNDTIWFCQIRNIITDCIDEVDDLKNANIYLSVSLKKLSPVQSTPELPKQDKKEREGPSSMSL